jgi:glycosyltransferase involved in cell wall biosynthesis
MASSDAMRAKNRILVIDMGSRMNRTGGEARLASRLYSGLKTAFKTYYLGYYTDFITKRKDTILLGRGKLINSKARNSRMSENRLFRFFYYLVLGRTMARSGVSRSVIEKVKRISPDVIIANSVQDYALLRLLERNGVKARTMYIDHGSISTSSSGYFTKEGMPLTIGTGINSLSADSARRKFFESFNMNIALNTAQFGAISMVTKKVLRIPNGIRPHNGTDADAMKRIRNLCRITGSSFVVVYIGRMFERQKRVSTLIGAFRKIKDADARLLLIGGGPSLRAYTEMASGDNRVFFLGPRRDRFINNAYGVADAFVLPSAWEGFNLTVLEAASHSVPLVISAGAYIEDLKGQEIGRLLCFKTGDEKDLQRVLERLMHDSTTQKEARKASNNIRRIFTEKKMLRKYASAVRKLCS